MAGDPAFKEWSDNIDRMNIEYQLEQNATAHSEAQMFPALTYENLRG